MDTSVFFFIVLYCIFEFEYFAKICREMHERIARRQQRSQAFLEQSLEDQTAQIMRRHGGLPRQNRQSRVGDGVVGLEDDGFLDDEVGYGGGGAGTGSVVSAGAGGAGGVGQSYDEYDDAPMPNDPQAGMIDPEVREVKRTVRAHEYVDGLLYIF